MEQWLVLQYPKRRNEEDTEKEESVYKGHFLPSIQPLSCQIYEVINIFLCLHH